MAISSDSFSLILSRNIFYKNSYRKILITNLLLFIVICLLVVFLYYQSSFFSVPKYFPTTPDGVVINSPPNRVNHLLLKRFNFDKNGTLLELPEIKARDLDLNQPDSNEHAILLYWVSKAIIAMFDLDFVNYRGVMQEMRHYFSSKGYERYIKALNESKNLDTIKNGKRVAFANIKGEAKVTKTGILEGHKVWIVEVPIMVTYEGYQQELLTQDLFSYYKCCSGIYFTVSFLWTGNISNQL